MKRFEMATARLRGTHFWALCAVLAMLAISIAAPKAAAQNDGTVVGTILNVEGKPWADLTMQAVSEQGAKQEVKTDKDGKYTIRNLKTGVYHVYAVLPAPNKPFDTVCQVQGGNPTRVDLNFKDIVAKQGAAGSEAVKKQEEQKKATETMKAHFAAGGALLEQERQAKKDLTTAKPDERDAAKQKLLDLSNQAATEFKAAQQAAGEKDSNQGLFWAKLGDAYDLAGRNDEAIAAYNQAIALKPEVAGNYNNLGNVLARTGKIDDAKTAFEKSASLDPANAALAWRNFGFSLYNAQRVSEAVEPLQKAVALDPANAQAWYYLGTALLAKMTTTKVGDKEQPVFAPGTIEAFQKASELDPGAGGWGAQARDSLAGLQAMAPGIDIKVSNKKKKP